jgi:hypothetical protein
MAQTITNEEFDVLSNLSQEQIGSMSLTQLKAVDDLMDEYQAARAEDKQRLIDRGFTEKDIATLDKAIEKAPEPTSGRGVGVRPGQFVTPLAVEGLKQGAQRAGIGILDLAMDIGVSTNLIDPKKRQEWKAGLADRRLKIALDNIAEFGQLPSSSSRLVGEVAPWLLALPAAAENMIALAAQRTLQGVAIGGATVQAADEELIDRAFSMTAGGVIGGASAGLSAWSMLRQKSAQSFTRAYNESTPEQAEMVQTLIQEMTSNPNFKISLAQATGNRNAFVLELGSAAAATKAAQNTNIEVVVKGLLKLARSQAAVGRSPNQIALSLRETMKTARKSIYDSAASTFAAESQAIRTQFGDDVVVGGDEFLAKIDSIIAEQQNTLLSVGGKPSKNLLRYRDEVDLIVNPVQVRVVPAKAATATEEAVPEKITLIDRSPTRKQQAAVEIPWAASKEAAEAKALEMNKFFAGATAEETQEIFTGLNSLIGGDAIIFDGARAGSNRTIGRAMMGALLESLDTPTANANAVKALAAMRDGYKFSMAQAQAIDDTVVAAVFGGKKLPKAPGKKLDAVMKNEKEDLVAVREFLEEWNPVLLGELRRAHLERVVKGGARPAQPAVDVPTSLPKLANRLADGFGRAGQAGKGLHSAATQASMQKFAKALRVINNKYFVGITPGGVRVEEVAINLISRSPEFMARFITRALSSGQSVEQALLSPQFRSAVIQIAEEPLSGTMTQAGKAAMVTLANFIRSNRDIERNRAAAERREEAREASVKPEGDF